MSHLLVCCIANPNVEKFSDKFCSKLNLIKGGALKSKCEFHLQPKTNKKVKEAQIPDIFACSLFKVDTRYMRIEMQKQEFEKYILLQCRKYTLITMIRTMAVFGVLLLCLSPAVSGLKHAFHFVVIFSSWFETFKIKNVAFCFEGLRHDDVRSANAKASPNQRHPLHQQHP